MIRNIHKSQFKIYLDRVINALFKSIDGRVEILTFKFQLIESSAPYIISRCFIYESLQIELIAY